MLGDGIIEGGMNQRPLSLLVLGRRSRTTPAAPLTDKISQHHAISDPLIVIANLESK